MIDLPRQHACRLGTNIGRADEKTFLQGASAVSMMAQVRKRNETQIFVAPFSVKRSVVCQDRLWTSHIFIAQEKPLMAIADSCL